MYVNSLKIFLSEIH